MGKFVGRESMSKQEVKNTILKQCTTVLVCIAEGMSFLIATPIVTQCHPGVPM